MATLYAQSTGNWSAILWNTAANGSGANQVPAAADTLVSNTFDVTVDGNYTVTLVTNTLGGTFLLTNGITLTCTDATAGVLGDFAAVAAVTNALASPNSATITAKIGGGNATNELAVSFTNTGGLTINGAITGGSAAGAHGITMSGGGTLSIVGAVVGGNSAGNCNGVYVSAGAGSINIVGNVSGGGGGSSTNASGIYILAADAISILIAGNIVAGGGTTGAHGITVLNPLSLATITVTGNVSGNGYSGPYPTVEAIGIAAYGGTVTITGNVTGGVYSTAYGVLMGSSNTKNLTITGTITANSSPGVHILGLGSITITGNIIAVTGVVGFSSAGSGNITITGSVTAATAVGVSSTGAGNLRIIGPLNAFTAAAISKTAGTSFLTGPFIRSATYPRVQVISAPQWLWDSSLVTPTYMDVYKSDEATKYPLYTADSIPGVPAIANVRHGTVYGSSNELTGTCYVPVAANVSLNVPVDNTVGAGLVVVADFEALLEGLLGLDPGENLLTELSAIETQIEVDLASIDTRLENLEDRLAEQVPTGPVVVIPAPELGQTTIWSMCYQPDGTIEEGASITIRCIKTDSANSTFDNTPITIVSNAAGLASGAIPRNPRLTFTAQRGDGKIVTFWGADADSIELPSLLGKP